MAAVLISYQGANLRRAALEPSMLHMKTELYLCSIRAGTVSPQATYPVSTRKIGIPGCSTPSQLDGEPESPACRAANRISPVESLSYDAIFPILSRGGHAEEPHHGRQNA